MFATGIDVHQEMGYGPLMSTETPDLFPHLPRSTVSEEKRDLWNEFKHAQETFGGLIPGAIAQHVLGITRQRLHQLGESGHIRTFKVLGVVSFSCEDVKQRLATMRAPEFQRGGRPFHVKA